MKDRNMRGNRALFRFYEELNDFLPEYYRKHRFQYRFDGNPGVKDAIEAIGVPHSEVDLVIVDGESVDFRYRLQDGDDVAVYPVFESLDISPIVRLRPKALRVTRFVLDVHLGKLARRLRMLGFDCLYRNDYEDMQIVAISARERRIILTRDRPLLFHGMVTHGYWVRSTDPKQQLREIVERFDLAGTIAAFSRCPACNGILECVAKADIEHRLLPKTKRHFDDFKRCRECGKIYWRGSHYERLLSNISKLIS